MTGQTIFASSMFAYGLFFIFTAYFIWKTNTSASNIQLRERIFREKISGVIMTFVALVWCARHGKSIFPGQAISSYFMPAAFILTWGAYFLLDFLPARALGALVILLAHYHLHWLFALTPPLRQLISAICFLTGTTGILICGKPCILRDFFRAVGKSERNRKFASAIAFICGLTYIVYSVYHLVNR
jgi:hypothetical protein